MISHKSNILYLVYFSHLKPLFVEVEVVDATEGGAVIGTLLRGFLRAVLSEVLDSLSNLDHEGRSAGMIMTIV